MILVFVIYTIGLIGAKWHLRSCYREARTLKSWTRFLNVNGNTHEIISKVDSNVNNTGSLSHGITFSVLSHCLLLTSFARLAALFEIFFVLFGCKKNKVYSSLHHASLFFITPRNLTSKCLTLARSFWQITHMQERDKQFSSRADENSNSIIKCVILEK